MRKTFLSPTTCAVVAHGYIPQLRLTNGARHGRREGYDWARQYESSDQRTEGGGHAKRGGWVPGAKTEVALDGVLEAFAQKRGKPRSKHEVGVCTRSRTF